MHTLGYATISCTIISHLFWPLLFTKKKKMNCMSNEQFERTSAYLIKSNVRFMAWSVYTVHSFLEAN